MSKPAGYLWLEQPVYDKLRGQAQLHLNQIMRPLEMYGQTPIVDDAKTAIMELMEQFGMRVRGKDIPYSVKYRWFR